MHDRRSRGRRWAIAGGIAVVIAAIVVIVVLVTRTVTAHTSSIP
jgi:t-SNARE complex subunit (syntaxin)